MDSTDTLFSVPYGHHTVVNLTSFLEAISKRPKKSSPKRALFQELVDFEDLLIPSAQDSLASDTRAFYEATRTASKRAKRNLVHNLKKLNNEDYQRKKIETDDDKAQNGPAEAKSNDAEVSISKEEAVPSARKRKHSEISKGARKPRKKKSSKKPKSRVCSVCYERLPMKTFPKADITPNCEHANNVCNVCIAAHIDASIDIGQFSFLACPVCPGRLALEDVKRLCSSDTFDRYDRLVTRTTLQKDPTFHFCLGKDCGSGQYNDDDDSSKMVCAVCQFLTCTRHGIAWHSGQTCGEYDVEVENFSDEAAHLNVLQRTVRQEAVEQEIAKQEAVRADAARQEAVREENARQEEAAAKQKAAEEDALKLKHVQDDKASCKTVKGIARTCPNAECGAPIQKTGGCDHMTCPQCSTDFCWHCMEEWFGQHDKGCPYSPRMYDRFGVWIGD